MDFTGKSMKGFVGAEFLPPYCRQSDVATMLKHLVPIAAAALLLLIILAAAVPLYHWFEEPEPSNGLAEGIERWRSHGFDSYQFLIRKNCDCGPPGNIPIRVVVRDSLAIAVYDERTAFDPDADKIDGVPNTVAALFEMVRLGADGTAALVEVAFDELFGYPSYLRFDPDSTIAGDEFDYTIGSFEAAP